MDIKKERDPMDIKKRRSFRFNGFTDFRLRYISTRRGRSMTNMLEHLIDMEYQRVKMEEKTS